MAEYISLRIPAYAAAVISEMQGRRNGFRPTEAVRSVAAAGLLINRAVANGNLVPEHIRSHDIRYVMFQMTVITDRQAFGTVVFASAAPPHRLTLLDIGPDALHPVFTAVRADALVQPQAAGTGRPLARTAVSFIRRSDTGAFSQIASAMLSASFNASPRGTTRFTSPQLPRLLGGDVFAEVQHLEGDAGRYHARQHDVGEMRSLARAWPRADRA